MSKNIGIILLAGLLAAPAVFAAQAVDVPAEGQVLGSSGVTTHDISK